MGEKGKPIDFQLSQGQVHDFKLAPKLLKGKKCKYVIGDCAYDSKHVLNIIKREIRDQEVIPNHPTKQVFMINRDIRKENLIERFFNKLKHFRAIATCYIKRGAYFLQAILYAAFIINIKFDDIS